MIWKIFNLIHSKHRYRYVLLPQSYVFDVLSRWKDIDYFIFLIYLILTICYCAILQSISNYSLIANRHFFSLKSLEWKHQRKITYWSIFLDGNFDFYLFTFYGSHIFHLKLFNHSIHPSLSKQIDKCQIVVEYSNRALNHCLR